MSAAILDHKRNPIGISGTGGTTRAGVGRKYRDCNLDDSYAESFRAGYALGASRLQSSLPTTSQNNQTVKARREVIPRAISSVSQARVWNLLIDVVAQSGSL
jgi:hypothetical protein